MGLKERLSQFIEYKGIARSTFERESGLSNGYTRNIKENLGSAKLEGILKAYPEMSRVWLLTGEGDMLRAAESDAVFIGRAQKALTENTVSVRFFEVTPTATFQEFCSGASEEPTLIEIIPKPDEAIDESFCVFEVSGDSMAPQIHSHSRVLCQEVPPTRWHTLKNSVVAIAYANEFVIKRISVNRLQSEDWLELSSDNPDYPAKEKVPFADIRCIFQAKRIISSDII